MKKVLAAIIVSLGLAGPGLSTASAEPISKLKISSNNRYLTHQDGTPFIWIGDTMWTFYWLSPTNWDTYLADRKAKGFNVIQLMLAYPNGPDAERKDYQGNYAFGGTNHNDISQPNSAYWANVDTFINKCEAQGIFVAPVLMWAGGGDEASFNAYSDTHLYNYGKWVGTRYKDENHIIWMTLGEAAGSSASNTKITQVIQGIRDGDTGAKLLSIHPNYTKATSPSWHSTVSFNSFQTSQWVDPTNTTPGGTCWGAITNDYGLSPTKPTFDSEGLYEGHAGNGGTGSSWDVRKRAYFTIFAGAFGHTYGAEEIMWANSNWATGLGREGSTHMKHLKNLLKSKPFNLLVPDQSLITAGQGGTTDYANHIQAAKGSDGSYAFIYTANGHNFSINTTKITQGTQVTAKWFNPKTAAYTTIGTFAKSSSHAFDPPGSTGNANDYVLVLEAASGGSLPAPWQTSDIGSPAVAGSAIESSGTFTITGAGADIWGSSDQFRYVYQPLSGDTDIKIKVNTLTNTNAWAKAGIMIRDGLAANARNAMVLITPTTTNGASFQYRTSTGGISYSAKVTGVAPPQWVRLVRSGSTFTAYKSSDGSNWGTAIGSASVSMGSTVYMGMAVTSHNTGSATTASISNVTIGGSTPPPPSTLPAPWVTAGIGSTAGTASVSSGTWTISAGGLDIAGTSDSFRYVYQPLSGDATITVKVNSLTNTSIWAKAGVMIRDGLAANAKFAMTSSTPVNKQEFKYRTSTGGTAGGVAVTTTAPANWVRLVRSGNSFSGYTSSDGTTWTQRGTTQTITMGTSVVIGLPVCAQHSTNTTTASISNVTITTPPAPSNWTGANVGAPPVNGSFSESGGTWTIAGSGIDVTGTSDQFYFVYKPLAGDCDVRLRVQSLTNTSIWAKAGIMIRDGLAANAKFAMTNSTPVNKQEFKYRTSTGGTAAGVAVTTTAPANWVRLVRSGSSFTGYTSSDGTTWTQRGTTQTISMGSTVYVGFIVCAQHTSSSTTGVFTNVTGMP